MNKDSLRFTFNLTHSYLEVARAAAGPLPFVHSSGSLDHVLKEHGHNPLANAILGIVSISVIYSYLAIEAHVNYQLYRLWERRHNESVESKRFLQILGNEKSFNVYRGHPKVRELPSRVKTLCTLMGYQKPQEAVPKIWQEFMELSRAARHFLVHPVPDPKGVQNNMKRILHDLPTGKWVDVATELIAFLYNQAGMEKPEWLIKNVLIRIEGIRVLPDEDIA
ncbi:MAG TPA: hypothetical protein VHT73_07855 [Thermodesulfobacteriota bacterium]|nr:hypothetical protein [Thermodesulfobacteriota bacterium]